MIDPDFELYEVMAHTNSHAFGLAKPLRFIGFLDWMECWRMLYLCSDRFSMTGSATCYTCNKNRGHAGLHGYGLSTGVEW